MEDNEKEHELEPGYLGPNLENHEEGYSGEVWNGIEKRIRKRKRRFAFWWIWGLGLLVTGLGLGLYFYPGLREKNEEIVIQNPTQNEVVISSETDVIKQEETTSANARDTSTSEEDQVQDTKNNSQEQSQLSESESGNLNASSGKTTIAHNRVRTNSNIDIRNTAQSKRKTQKEANVLVPNAISEKENIANLKDRKVRPDLSKRTMRDEPAGSPEPVVKNDEVGKSELATTVTIAEKDQLTSKSESEVVVKQENKKAQEESIVVKDSPLEPEKNESTAVKSIAEEVPVVASDSLSREKKLITVSRIDSILPPILLKDSTQLKGKSRPFWSLELGGGILFQESLLSGYNSNSYSPDNKESYLMFRKGSGKAATMVVLNGNRLWPILHNLYCGIRFRLGFVYQEVEVGHDAGKYSASRFTYGADSLSFEAVTESETGYSTYNRNTFLGDAGIQIQYKPSHFPIGIGVHWAAIRYQTSYGGSGIFDKDGVQFFVRPPDVRLFAPLGIHSEVFVESMMLNWKNYSLPIPIQNTGRNLGILLGLGWKW